MNNREFDLYKDIQCRTNGEIYIGVVGPVRTGKSTFIKKFMEQCVLPQIENEYSKNRAIDELPQSGQGKTIMTTEPKFVPQEAVTISLDDSSEAKIRMIDCVGFTVSDAFGYSEGDEDRLVKTPWFTDDVPFEEAAVIGTQKVITEHATVAVLVTTDGTIGNIKRGSYENAERQTVDELKSANKPFVVVINSKNPLSKETIELRDKLEKEYEVTVMTQDCSSLTKEDCLGIIERILMEFNITKIEYNIPKWVEILDNDLPIKQKVFDIARSFLNSVSKMTDLSEYNYEDSLDEVVKGFMVEKTDLSTGVIRVRIDIDDSYYYENISRLSGCKIESEEQLIKLILDLTKIKNEYDKVKDAFEAVSQKGYGVVMPELDDITMEDPVLIAHGNKYGVKMKAISPSIHMIRANIETEIAPIVGNKDQAMDLISYIKDGENNGSGVWGTNIFGKSIGELMEDGIRNKILQMDDECQIKLQDTMQKIVNDSNGGMILIII